MGNLRLMVCVMPRIGFIFFALILALGSAVAEPPTSSEAAHQLLRGRLDSPPRQAKVSPAPTAEPKHETGQAEHRLTSLQWTDSSPPETAAPETVEPLPTDLDGLLFHDLNTFVEDLHKKRRE